MAAERSATGGSLTKTTPPVRLKFPNASRVCLVESFGDLGRRRVREVFRTDKAERDTPASGELLELLEGMGLLVLVCLQLSEVCQWTA